MDVLIQSFKTSCTTSNSTDLIFLSSVKFSSTSISRTLRDLIPMVKKKSSTKLLIVLFIKCLLITKKKKKKKRSSINYLSFLVYFISSKKHQATQAETMSFTTLNPLYVFYIEQLLNKCLITQQLMRNKNNTYGKELL